MAGKGVFFRHELEGVVEFFFRHFPCDQRAVSEFCGEHGLAHAADDACLLHCADAFDHGFERDTGFIGDDLERMALETGYEVFGNSEDLRVDGIGDGGGDR